MIKIEHVDPPENIDEFACFVHKQTVSHQIGFTEFSGLLHVVFEKHPSYSGSESKFICICAEEETAAKIASLLTKDHKRRFR